MTKFMSLMLFLLAYLMFTI